MNATTIDLSRFCQDEILAAKYEMSRPFVVNAWRYATDGKICVRVPALGEPDSEAHDGHPFPDCETLPWNGCQQCRSVLPEKPYVVSSEYIEKCPDCKTTEIKCEKCDGGTVRCPHCEFDHVCGHCRGIGYFIRHEPKKCPTCLNLETVKVKRPTSYILYHRRFGVIAAQYYDLIRTLPGVRFHVSTIWPIINFVFDGGEICLAGMTQWKNEIAAAAHHYGIELTSGTA